MQKGTVSGAVTSEPLPSARATSAIRNLWWSGARQENAAANLAFRRVAEHRIKEGPRAFSVGILSQLPSHRGGDGHGNCAGHAFGMRMRDE